MEDVEWRTYGILLHTVITYACLYRVVEMSAVRRNRAAVAPVIAYWEPHLTHYGQRTIQDNPNA